MSSTHNQLVIGITAAASGHGPSYLSQGPPPSGTPDLPYPMCSWIWILSVMRTPSELKCDNATLTLPINDTIYNRTERLDMRNKEPPSWMKQFANFRPITPDIWFDQ